MRIIVADDHPLYREGLAQTLAELDGAEVVAEAASGEEAIRAVAEHRPDVAIMDLHMPGMNGIDATRAITERFPDTAVLVLTMLEGDAALVAALRAGARGYLVKGANRTEIRRAVEAVADGQVIVGGDVAAALGRHLHEAPGPSAAFPDLTDRERRVLELMAHGLTNPAIAARLHLSEKTVRNYVSAIFAKLHVTERGAAIARARDEGLGAGSLPGRDR